MKLFPNFNSTGDYNGKQYAFRNPLNLPEQDLDSLLIKNNIDPSKIPAGKKADVLMKSIRINKKYTTN